MVSSWISMETRVDGKAGHSACIAWRMASVHCVAQHGSPRHCRSVSRCPNPNQVGITMPAFALYKNVITTVPGCVDKCAMPQSCRTHGVRVPASCIAHVPEAQGGSLRGPPTVHLWLWHVYQGPGVPTRTAHLRTCALAPPPQVSGVPEDAPTPRWAVFLAGALAGCTATCLCYPLDVVHRRAQKRPTSQQPMRPPAAAEAIHLLRAALCAREERPRRLEVPMRGCGGAPVPAPRSPMPPPI